MTETITHNKHNGKLDRKETGNFDKYDILTNADKFF